MLVEEEVEDENPSNTSWSMASTRFGTTTVSLGGCDVKSVSKLQLSALCRCNNNNIIRRFKQ